MENKQRAMKMGIRANGNLGQHFQKQASKWDPICSRAYCMDAELLTNQCLFWGSKSGGSEAPISAGFPPKWLNKGLLRYSNLGGSEWIRQNRVGA